RVDRRTEKRAGPPIVDHADELEVRVLQTDVGDLGDCAGAVKHDADAAAVGAVRIGGGDQAGANVLPRFGVQMKRSFQIGPRGAGFFRHAGRRDQILDAIGTDVDDLYVSFVHEPADQRVGEAEGDP